MILLLACGCAQRHRQVTPGIYYWKTRYEIDSLSTQKLQQLQVNKIYLRVFDVDWDEAHRAAMPVANVRIRQALQPGGDYVPVVFITQKTLAQLTDADIPTLAEHITKMLQSICTSNGIAPKEIQIDCDWTAGTKELYFELLKTLKLQPFVQNKILSCTIRMHQVKYTTRNGIPPADRGMLMCYNMGDTKKYGPHNSVLDAGGAKQYLKNIGGYPLPLDVALPLFDWCLLFKNQQLRGVLHDVQPQQITASPAFVHTKGCLYRCVQPIEIGGYRFAVGDEVRVEAPGIDEIQEVAGYVSERIKNDTFSVALFDCDSITLNKFSIHELETVYSSFR